MSKQAPLILHRNVSMMICEDAAILEETLRTIDLSNLPIVRVGNRALVAPVSALDLIRHALHERGTYPRLVGDLMADDEGLNADDMVEERKEKESA